MRFAFMLVAALAAVMLPSGAASAQDRDLARRTELAGQYLRLSMGDDLRPVIEAVVEEELALSGDTTPEQRAWYRDNVPVFFEDFMAELIEQVAPRYAASLTEDELSAGIAFYSSPLGRSLARKQMALQVDLEEELYAAMETMAVNMQAKYCAAFTCPETIQIVPSRK